LFASAELGWSVVLTVRQANAIKKLVRSFMISLTCTDHGQGEQLSRDHSFQLVFWPNAN
jgi:hypothetical protein